MNVRQGKLTAMVIGLSFVVVAVMGCAKDQPETVTPTAGVQQEMMEEGAVTAEDIAEEPAQHVGKLVTIEAEVEEVYNPRAMQVESMELFDEELLVLTKSDVFFPDNELEDGDDVMITGTVRMFVAADLEQELGWDLDPELEMEYENKPVVIADRIQTQDERASIWTHREEMMQ